MKKPPTHEQACALILKLLDKRTPRPVLVGEAAVILGQEWSLTATEGLFLWMALRGLIRPVNKAEKHRYDVRTGWVVY